MKTLIILLTFICLSGYSQKSKYTTEIIKVYGICGMCEERIESALDIIGIRSAQWDVNTQLLKVVFNTDKISVHEIHRACAEVGHSTEKMKCTDAAYKSLHACCKYNDPEVIKNH